MNTTTSVNFLIKFAAKCDRVLTAEQVLAAENGTGYFNGLMRMKAPASDVDRARFTDRHGRHGVVLFNKLGNVVFFQRYTDNDNVVVSNTPQAWTNVIPQGALTKSDVERILNTFNDVNYVNQIMEDITSAYAKLQQAS